MAGPGHESNYKWRDTTSEVIIDATAPGNKYLDRSPYLKEDSEKEVISKGYSTVDLKAAYNGTKAEVGVPRDDLYGGAVNFPE